jgi:hypothetical protein
MFRFWFRELMGWLLVALGLGIFYVCFAILLGSEEPSIFEAPALTLIGIIVFRGGIQLLKVALAARIAMRAPVESSRPSERGNQKNAPPPLDW